MYIFYNFIFGLFYIEFNNLNLKIFFLYIYYKMSESRSASQRLFNVNVNGNLTVTGNVANTGTLTSTGAVNANAAINANAGIVNTGTITSTGLVTASAGVKTDGRMTNNYLFYSLFGIAAGTTVEADVVGALLTDSLTAETITAAEAQGNTAADYTIGAGNRIVSTPIEGGSAANLILPSAVADQVVVVKLTAAWDGGENLVITCGTDDVFETGTTLTCGGVTSDASDADDTKLTITSKGNGKWGAAGSHLLFYALDDSTWTVRTGKTVAAGDGNVNLVVAFS